MKIAKKLMLFSLIFSILGSNMSVYATSDTELTEDEIVSEEIGTEEVIEADGEGPQIFVSVGDVEAGRKVPEGVIVGTTDISGMTVDEAIAAVNAEVESLSQLGVTIKVDDRSIETNLAALGFYSDNVEDCVAQGAMIGRAGTLIKRYKDISDVSAASKVYDLSFGISEQTVTEFMTATADSYTIQPVDSTIERRGGSFDITESATGIQIDQGATIKEIMSGFEGWNREAVELQAVTVVLEPKYTEDVLAQIKDRIGSFSTALSANMTTGKGKNVLIGCDKIDGTVILPGEEWSVFETLAPFTVENGYDEATAYLNGEYVQEIGGGVCQLATTLYNAALYSEITISMRYCHHMTVGYTDISFDATVNDYGTKDLKLTNDFDFPVYIEAYYSDGDVYFNIYGVETRDPRRTLGFRSEVLSEELPTEVIETPDPTLPEGTKKLVQKAHAAITAVAYKQIYYDGVLIEEQYLHTDNYKSSPAKYLVGTAPVEQAAEQSAA